MDPRTRSWFLALVLAQGLHSVEEYRFRLWEVLPPARIASGLVSSDLPTGFALLNGALFAFGLWCVLGPARTGRASARGLAWAWVAVEVGNGVVHPLLAVWAGGYFPGAATAPLLLVLALVLGRRLLHVPGRNPAAGPA